MFCSASRSLLDESGNSARSQIIIEQVVEMAKQLGTTTIGEGAETEGQSDFLRSIECDAAQGLNQCR